MVKISVVIPSYNNSKYLPLAVNSVLRQTYQDFEIVIADDGSTDNTKKLVEEFIKDNPEKEIMYLSQNNKGPSAARNLGIRHVRGEYLAFLDADDEWLPEKLEKQIRYLEAHLTVGCVGCGNYIIDADGRVIKELKTNSYKSREIILKELLIRNVISGSFSSMLFRGECFRNVDLFDEMLRGSEDWDMILRILLKHEVVFLEDTLFKYRFHCNNSHKNIALMKSNQKQFAKKRLVNKGIVVRCKAYSYIYLDTSREYLADGQKLKAIKNIILAIAAYPLKIYENDNKYQIFFEALFPGRVVSLLRFLRGTSRIC